MWNKCIQALDVFCEEELGEVQRESEQVKIWGAWFVPWMF